MWLPINIVSQAIEPERESVDVGGRPVQVRAPSSYFVIEQPGTKIRPLLGKRVHSFNMRHQRLHWWEVHLPLLIDPVVAAIPEYHRFRPNLQLLMYLVSHLP